MSRTYRSFWTSWTFLIVSSRSKRVACMHSSRPISSAAILTSFSCSLYELLWYIGISNEDSVLLIWVYPEPALRVAEINSFAISCYWCYCLYQYMLNSCYKNISVTHCFCDIYIIPKHLFSLLSFYFLFVFLVSSYSCCRWTVVTLHGPYTS